MPEWDEDSPRLRENLGQILREIVPAAQQREIPTLQAARSWQTLMMEGLDVPDRRYVGAFRGESGLERVQVRVGTNYGVDSAYVAEALSRFETKLQTLVAALDRLLPIDQELDADQLAAVIDLCAWVHAEWGASIHLRTAMVGRHAFGPIALPFVTVFPHSSTCVRDLTPAMEMPARRRCKANGNRLR